MRQGIVTHNPFRFATRDMPTHKRVEARFEIRARIQGQIDAIDRDIVLALSRRDAKAIAELTDRRNRLAEEMP